MSASALYGLLAWALLAGALANLTPWGRRLPVALGVAGLALAPFFSGESVAMALHGAFAAPSATLVQLALWRLAAPGRPPIAATRAAPVLVAMAALLYPLALGLGPFDPYGLGYQPQLLLAALLPVAAWLAWNRQQAWLVLLGIDLLAYAAGLFDNAWDAFLDPALVLMAGVILLRGRRRHPTTGS